MRSGYGKRSREERKADTHHNGQTGADAPDGIELDKRADTSDDHTVLYQCRTNSRVDTCNIGKDDNRRDIGHEHGQYMLQPERNGLHNGYAAIKLIDVAVFLHNDIGSLVF